MCRYYSKKIISFLSFCFIFFSINNLFAEEYKIGGKNGWKDVPYRDGIVEGKGRYGYTCLELATNSFEVMQVVLLVQQILQLQFLIVLIMVMF